MSPDDKRHGTNAGAIRHWRDRETPCEPCAQAARRARKRGRLAAERGMPAMVPLGDDAWAVLDRTPWNQLAQQTGMLTHVLIRLHGRGHDALVQRKTRDRILAAEPRWTVVGVQRRLRALSRLGWSMRAISDLTGIDMDALKRLRRSDDRVFVRTYVGDAVVEIYDRLAMTLPPPGRSATRTKVEAEREGWLAPLAWDDPDTDPEPPRTAFDHGIDPVVVMRLLEGRTVKSNKAEKEEAIRRWVDNGGTKTEFCNLHGWAPGRYARGSHLRVVQEVAS